MAVVDLVEASQRHCRVCTLSSCSRRVAEGCATLFYSDGTCRKIQKSILTQTLEYVEILHRSHQHGHDFENDGNSIICRSTDATWHSIQVVLLRYKYLTARYRYECYCLIQKLRFRSSGWWPS